MCLWSCLDEIHEGAVNTCLWACQGPTEGQHSPPVYKHKNLTWLSSDKCVMSKGLQFVVPTASLKEKAVYFGDLGKGNLGLCPVPLGPTVCGVAMMLP